MSNSAIRLSFVILVLSLGAASQTSPRPISASQVLSLQAGGVLPENLVHEITSRGLSFQPDEDYLTQLQRAGASPTLVAAVKRAKVTLLAGEGKPNKELLQQLSRAGAFIKDKQFDQAVAQLNTALRDSFAAPETGFVMGRLLCQKEEWQQAAAV